MKFVLEGTRDAGTDLPFLCLRCYQHRAAGLEISCAGCTSKGSFTSTRQRDFRLPAPTSVGEQRAIAEALSDTDALIESLEQLLAKKRQIKQGAMQELLTGKRRLSGFSGEWEIKQLGQLGSTFGGLTGKTKSDFGCGAARYITFMNIMTRRRD